MEEQVGERVEAVDRLVGVERMVSVVVEEEVVCTTQVPRAVWVALVLLSLLTPLGRLMSQREPLHQMPL